LSIYETVKEQLDLRTVAEHYGIDSRNGMTACIFHDDRNPSMKLYSRPLLLLRLQCLRRRDRFHGRAVRNITGASRTEARCRFRYSRTVTLPFHSRQSKPSSPLSGSDRENRRHSALSAITATCYVPPEQNLRRNHPTSRFIRCLSQRACSTSTEYEFYCDIFISGSKEETHGIYEREEGFTQ
jgi:hypothetical protein